MKLVFTKRPKEEDWLPTFSKELFLSWLHFNDIWPDKLNSKIDYNNLYHFYDVILFPSPGNKRDNVETLATDIIKLFKVKYIDKHWWRWEGKTEIKGLRFWIEAK